MAQASVQVTSSRSNGILVYGEAFSISIIGKRMVLRCIILAVLLNQTILNFETNHLDVKR